METLDETTTVIDLDILVNNDDCKCQSAHTVSTAPACSESVVARKIVCDKAFNICQSSLDWNTSMMSLPWKTCEICHIPVQECWKIIPI